MKVPLDLEQANGIYLDSLTQELIELWELPLVVVFYIIFVLNWGAPMPRPPNVSTSSNNFQGFENRLPTFIVGKIINAKLKFMLYLNIVWFATQLNNKKC